MLLNVIVPREGGGVFFILGGIKGVGLMVMGEPGHGEGGWDCN